MIKWARELIRLLTSIDERLKKIESSMSTNERGKYFMRTGGKYD